MDELSELQMNVLRAANSRDARGELIPLKAIWLQGSCYLCLDVFKDKMVEANLNSETIAGLTSNRLLEIQSCTKAGASLYLTDAGKKLLEACEAQNPNN